MRGGGWEEVGGGKEVEETSKTGHSIKEMHPSITRKKSRKEEIG